MCIIEQHNLDRAFDALEKFIQVTDCNSGIITWKLLKSVTVTCKEL